MKIILLSIFLFLYSVQITFTQDLQIIVDSLSSDFDQIRLPHIGKNDKLFIPSFNGNLYIKDQSEWSTHIIKEDGNLWGAVVDNNDLIWICGQSGLYSYDLTTVTEYTSTNSDLPHSDIRNIKINDDGIIWMTAWNNGVIVKDENEYTHITKDNSELSSNFVDLIKFLDDGRTILTRSSKFFIVDESNNWETIDLGPLLSFGTNINDMYIDGEEILIASSKGIKSYNLSTSTATDMSQDFGGEVELISIYKDNIGGIWAYEKSEGLHYFSGNGDKYFFDRFDYNLANRVVSLFEHDDTLWLSGEGSVGAVIYGISIPGVTTNTINTKDESVKVYPNPFSNAIHIESSKKISGIYLYDLNGHIVYQNNSQVVDVSYLPKGIYILEIESITSSKTIKQIVIKN